MNDYYKHLRPILIKITEKIKTGIIIAGFATLLSAPRYYHQVNYLLVHILKPALSQDELKLIFLYQLLSVLFICTFCSIVGLLYYERAGIEPFSKTLKASKIFPALVFGMALIPFSYFLADRYIIMAQPLIYPTKAIYAFLFPFSYSFPEEVIARLGLFTILAYILRAFRPRASLVWISLVISVFITVSGSLTKKSLGIQNIDPIPFLEVLAFGFLVSFISSELYHRKGFLSCVLFRFGLGIKFIVYLFIPR